MNNLQTAILFLLILAGSSAVLYLLIRLISHIIFLRNELRYVNMEIKRTTGKEQEYWLKRRRELLRLRLTFRK